jgi:hypothetical protein
MPGRGVAITHCQPAAHWQMTELGLCVNLESMWDDFESSVDRFIGSLARNGDRRTRTLEFFDKTRWTVQAVEITVPTARVIRRLGGSQIITPSVSAGSATTMAPMTARDEA